MVQMVQSGKDTFKGNSHKVGLHRKPLRLPLLDQIHRQPGKAPLTHQVSLCFNKQLTLQEIECNALGEVRYPWTLLDDQHRVGCVFSFRSLECQQYLQQRLFSEDSRPQAESYISQWNLIATEVHVTPVNSFWHDVHALVGVCLNHELDLFGIRLMSNGNILWPSSIHFEDTQLRHSIEEHIRASASLAI